MMRFGSSLSSSPPPLRTLERRVCCVRVSSCVPRAVACEPRVQHSLSNARSPHAPSPVAVDHQRGSAACTGGARLVRALLLCRQRTGARQLFGNDELLSLFGFGNVMFDSVGCVQQPRWGRLVRWRLATTFPPVRLLARGPAYTRLPSAPWWPATVTEPQRRVSRGTPIL